MKNQEIGLTGSSTTSEMLTYLSDNLARASSFLSYVILHFSDSKLFSPSFESLSSAFSNSFSH